MVENSAARRVFANSNCGQSAISSQPFVAINLPSPLWSETIGRRHESSLVSDGDDHMHSQPISVATIKKWEAIACDRLNHALVVYKRDDGLFSVDVFEVLDVFENEVGTQCLHALSLVTKYNGPQFLQSPSAAVAGRAAEYVVEIPLGSIVESHRYQFGTGLNDLDIRRYDESVAKVRQRQPIHRASRSTVGLDRLPDFSKSTDRGTSELFRPRMGCMMLLLYASALFGFALWMF